MKTIIKNAKIILKGNETEIVDILIENGKFIEIRKGIEVDSNVNIYDAEERLTIPGGVDVHVHFRQPGFEEKETIKTGSMAALRGGFTTVMPMPNLNPCPDKIENTVEYMKMIEENSLVHTYPIAAITEKSNGEKISDMKGLKDKFGINAFSDDGKGVQSIEVMKKAMELAKLQGGLISAHTEDITYRKPNASVYDGENAKRNGWIGIPREAEYKQVERDLQLAYKIGVKYHVCHISTKESVEAVKKYKALGANVTAEAAAHHMILTDEDVVNANFKMNPPLKPEEDRQAVVNALLDGTIDFIASDHAPHTKKEKDLPMDQAPFGIVGLETTIPLIYTNFVKKGIFTLEQFQNFICTKPAERFELGGKGKIEVGYDADITILSEDEVEIKGEDFLSKGKNSPFIGMICKGYPVYTFVSGICKFEKGKING